MADTDNLTPAAIVKRLDDNIIGQHDAKRAVALAFRNRWRRMQIDDEDMRREITPKNILLVGPTGVGKTEIARRLARIANAPFIKVEATKFTEVGYVGRDVDSIIRDLAAIGATLAREELEGKHADAAEESARDRVVDALEPVDDSERKKLELHVEGGKKDAEEIEADFKPLDKDTKVEIHGMENMPNMDQLSGMLRNFTRDINAKQNTRKKTSIKDALRHFRQEELEAQITDEAVAELAREMVEQNGIVFIDEIDKVASRSEHALDISRAGVQRDLLPLVEGTTVQTKIGPISTTHILFIASGSFHFAKPSDLVPELQGRLPVRVNLDSLSANDFERILSETDYCLTRQYQELLATEDVRLEFSDDAIKRIAEIAFDVNERQENIGARRLHTIMEKLVEAVAYEADSMGGTTYQFNADTVDEKLALFSSDDEASRIFL